jgi:hypothetical protein
MEAFPKCNTGLCEIDVFPKSMFFAPLFDVDVPLLQDLPVDGDINGEMEEVVLMSCGL